MPAGLAGAGYMGFAFEAVKGTPIAPSDASTQWVPILDEALEYTEARYFSPQIRESVIVSDVEQGYYHVQGQINLEVDVENFCYLMYASRHTPSLTAGVYSFIPSQAGATSTAAGPTTPKTATITVVRNGIGFSYAGCTFGIVKIEVSTADGVLKATLDVVGESEVEPGDLGPPTWADANLFGAAAHTVLTGAAGIAPTFTEVDDFDGFTFTADHQALPQNRIKPTRGAAFVKYGETMVTVDSVLDFLDRTDYNSFVATTQAAFMLQSVKPTGASWAACTSGVQVQVNRGVFETYSIPLKGLADIVTATVQARGIGIAGGDAYVIRVKSDKVIT
jgi:hypothetical protein